MALAAGPTLVAGEAPWPAGAALYEGHHYWAADEVEDLSWHGGRKDCASRGGYVAVVADEAEARFVAEPRTFWRGCLR